MELLRERYDEPSEEQGAPPILRSEFTCPTDQIGLHPIIKDGAAANPDAGQATA
jgi:hypothetical protein